MYKRYSKRMLEDIRKKAKQYSDSEHTLFILQGLLPCPRCKGKRVMPHKTEKPVDGKYYHFSRSCQWCGQTETPGYFTTQEVAEYGIRGEFK